MSKKFKKILITGADGFIGSHLAEYLVRQGYGVRAFVFYNSFNTWGWLDTVSQDILDAMEIFTGDIRDPNGVRTAIRGCDAVLHLAALIAIPYSYHSPDSYVDTNIRGTLNILQAARDAGVCKIIHTSTSEVYGTAQFVPITESHPLHPQSPYAATKVGADQLALSFQRSFATPVAIIRPFNTYGPRQSARAVIPTIITQIAKGCKKIRLGSLSPTRDFNYVSDTVRAFESVLLSDKAIGQVLNAGSGFEVSIGDTAQLIAELMKADVEIECESERLRPVNSEVERLWADNTKLREMTGWQPQFGGKDGFRKGLQHTAEWFCNPSNLGHYKTDIYNI
jgi:NAD dependent epimerase/dehydratase